MVTINESSGVGAVEWQSDLDLQKLIMRLYATNFSLLA